MITIETLTQKTLSLEENDYEHRVYTNRICGINIENSIASKSKGINATIGVF